MQRFFLLVVLFTFGNVHLLVAQFESVRITIDGLTCSMCSFGVESALKKLPFVSTVDMDLNANTAFVRFRSAEEDISIHELARKVREAGFSVRSMEASLSPETRFDPQDHSFVSGSTLCRFLSPPPSESKSAQHVVFIGKEFMDKKSWKKWQPKLEAVDSPLGIPDQIEELCYVIP